MGAAQEQLAASAKPVVREVIAAEVGALLGGAASLGAYNAAFLERHGADSLRHRAAAAEMAALLEPEEKAKAAQIILKRGGLLGAHLPARGVACMHAFQAGGFCHIWKADGNVLNMR